MNGATELCGLRVSGALAPVGRATSGRAELVMEAGPVTAGGDEGDVDQDGNGSPVIVREVGQVTFVRFRGLADAVLDMRAGTATIDVCPDAPPGMDQVLAGGPVLALALALRGRPCLHASAVSVDGRAVAFAAPSGGGKSTLAALACRAGAELVADDILALAVGASEVGCLPGSRELRLRAAAAELLAADWPRRTTADARVAVLVGSQTMGTPALTAIVLLAGTVDGTERVERLSGAAAGTALLACSRLAAMELPHHPQSMLELAATLAPRIPIYRVTMRRLTRAGLPEPVRAVLQEHLGFPG